MTNYCLNSDLKLRLAKSSSGTYAISDADLTSLAQQATQLTKALVRFRGVTPPSASDSDNILTQIAIEIGIALIEGSFWCRAGDISTMSRVLPLYVKDMLDGYVNSTLASSDIAKQSAIDLENQTWRQLSPSVQKSRCPRAISMDPRPSRTVSSRN